MSRCQTLFGSPEIGGQILCRNHFDGVPRADRQCVGIGLFPFDVDASFTAHAAIEVDLAPCLVALDTEAKALCLDAIDRTHLNARLTAGAIIGVDNRDFLGEFLARSLFFRHRCSPGAT